MTLTRLIPLVIDASLALMVFGIGLAAVPRSVRDVLARPGLLGRSVVAMHLCMPALVLGFGLVARLEPAMLAGLAALAVSPIPPFLPARILKAGGTPTFVVGLTAVTTSMAIVVVPLSIALLDQFTGRALPLGARQVARVVLVSVLLPLLAGLAVQRLRPQAALRLARPMLVGAGVMLAIAAIPLLVRTGPAMIRLVGDFTLVAIASSFSPDSRSDTCSAARTRTIVRCSPSRRRRATPASRWRPRTPRSPIGPRSPRRYCCT